MAGRELLRLQPLEALGPGLVVSSAATLLNLFYGLYLLSDVVTSAGVLVGVRLVALTGWRVLDPICATLVALNIL